MKRTGLWLGLFLLAARMAAGCTTADVVADTPDAATHQRQELGGAAGYLGLTLVTDLGDFNGEPMLILDVTETGTGAVHHFRAGERELRQKAGGKGVPMVMPLPAGTYRLSGSDLRLAGARLAGKDFRDSDQPLGLEQDLQPFTIVADSMTHLAVVTLKLAEKEASGVLQFNTTATIAMTRPPAVVWAPYRSILAEKPGTLLKKTRDGKYSWPVFDLNHQGGGGTLSDAEVSKVTHGRQTEVEACYLRYAPRTHGRVDIRYVVGPAGAVSEAAVQNTTLKQPKAEDCIVSVVKGMKFPPTPDEDFETWTASWTF
jgi:hypothetical protein